MLALDSCGISPGKTASYDVESPAKLNLFLHITGQRPDGYHNVQSVLCRLSLADTLSFAAGQDMEYNNTPPPLLTLTSNQFIGEDTNNLIIKAGQLLVDFCQKNHHLTPHAHIFPLHIALQKRIPMGAGLGGGSSNAATTLRALNTLWQLHLPDTLLLKLGAALGADVPFFIQNARSMLAGGIGDQLTAIDLPDTQFLLLFPGVHNSTQHFFQHPDLPKNTPWIDTPNPIHFLYQLNPPYHNSFEAIACQNPAIADALHYLTTLLPATTATPRLTGTGSSVFLPLTHPPTFNMLAHWQKHAPCPMVLTHLA